MPLMIIDILLHTCKLTLFSIISISQKWVTENCKDFQTLQFIAYFAYKECLILDVI